MTGPELKQLRELINWSVVLFGRNAHCVMSSARPLGGYRMFGSRHGDHGD
jgi:hypothetical protein